MSMTGKTGKRATTKTIQVIRALRLFLTPQISRTRRLNAPGVSRPGRERRQTLEYQGIGDGKGEFVRTVILFGGLVWPERARKEPVGLRTPAHQIHVLNRLPRHSLDQVVEHCHRDYLSSAHRDRDVAEVASERILKLRGSCADANERTRCIEPPQLLGQQSGGACFP